MMNSEHQSAAAQLMANTNLFPIYLFPCIRNTGQGNAMRAFNFSTVVSTWSSKRKRRVSVDPQCAPQRHPLVESWQTFEVGSVAQTIAHEVGHVLGLSHDACFGTATGLMKSSGYTFNPDQICLSRQLANQMTAL